MAVQGRVGALALVAAMGLGCGARGNTGGLTDPPDTGASVDPKDVGAATDDAPAVVDAGAPVDLGFATDLGSAPDAGFAMDAGFAVDLGTSVDLGTDRGSVTPADLGGPVDVGCVASDENTNARCADGVDNDCDGYVDCNDHSCATTPAVTLCAVDAGCVRLGSESTTAACGNGVDDDCDGYVDCTDFDCQRASVLICPYDAGVRVDSGCVRAGSENNVAACGNGVDDDCDGYVDCNDFDCPATVCPRDGGATADRPACDSGGALENTPGACGDGVDNDCDGHIDCTDDNCSCVGACAPGRLSPPGCTCGGVENTSALCGDGVDNDCNGFRDCADFGCSRNPAVTFCRDGG